MVGQSPETRYSEAGNLINRLEEPVASIVSQQQPQTSSALLKPTTTSTLDFDGKNEKFEMLEDLFQTMLKMQPQLSEAMKTNYFPSYVRKEALQTFTLINVSEKQLLEGVLIIFSRKYVRPQSQATAHKNGINSLSTPTRNHSQISFRN